MRTALEAGAAITARAAKAVGEGGADAGHWASAARAYVGKAGPEVIQDCIQMHGGIGVTAEHDLHLFLRRAVVDAQAYGTADDFTRRLVDLIDTKG
jgi:alkylation response protein AidB-like acyl-CoA dehydrogenase